MFLLIWLNRCTRASTRWNCSRVKGFSRKSNAPRRIASTAVLVVPSLRGTQHDRQGGIEAQNLRQQIEALFRAEV